MRVVVIGSGPAGLVTLKYLITSHLFLDTESVEAKLFSSDAAVGGTFFARTYEDAEVSGTSLMSFRNLGFFFLG